MHPADRPEQPQFFIHRQSREKIAAWFTELNKIALKKPGLNYKVTTYSPNATQAEIARTPASQVGSRGFKFA
jgi:hypothetical protein